MGVNLLGLAGLAAFRLQFPIPQEHNLARGRCLMMGDSPQGQAHLLQQLRSWLRNLTKNGGWGFANSARLTIAFLPTLSHAVCQERECLEILSQGEVSQSKIKHCLHGEYNALHEVIHEKAKRKYFLCTQNICFPFITDRQLNQLTSV